MQLRVLGFVFLTASAGSLLWSPPARAAESCMNDIDCKANGTGCGSDVCDWSTPPIQLCKPASGSPGWCTVDTDCKCPGAKCVGVMCTYVRPDGGAGSGSSSSGSSSGASTGSSSSSGASSSGAKTTGGSSSGSSGGCSAATSSSQTPWGFAAIVAAFGLVAGRRRRRA